MKITRINTAITHKNLNITNTTNPTKAEKNNFISIQASTIPSFGKFSSYLWTMKDMISEFSQPQTSTPSDYEKRLAFLKKQNVDDLYAKQIALLNTKQYEQAVELLKRNVSEQSALHAARLNDERYQQALALTEEGIIDNNLNPLANNNKETFNRILDLRQKGMHIDYLPLYTRLNPQQHKQAAELVQKGWQQNIAAYMVQLSKEQQDIFFKLISEDIHAHFAFEIAKQKQSVRNRTLSLIKDGISPYDAIEIAELRRFERKRAKEIQPLNVGESNIVNFARLKGKDKKRALELFHMGVLPEYITNIIMVEKGFLDNDEYKEYLNQGYSHSMAYAISLLTEEEIEQLKKLEQKYPQIKDLYKDNYDLNLIKNQLTDENDNEVIFSKETRTPDGTLITIFKTFSEDGTVTTSRTEEYNDKSTLSVMKNGNREIRAKYDKFGQIKELLHILEDEDDHSILGAVYSKASEVLPGVFDSVYYDISEFRQDNSTNIEAMDFEISNMITGEGLQLSKASRNPDGSISFWEKFSSNDCITEREYSEKKDEQGNILESSYFYTIKRDDGTELMNISRHRETNKNGSITDTINGIEYTLVFDDKAKTVTITDRNNSKTLDFTNILPFYSKEQVWRTIKNQPVDTLLSITQNIDKWTYCNEEDSQVYRHINEICTGKDISVVAHETGHIKQHERPAIVDNLIFLESYDNEMMNFLTNFPFNEQEPIQYFSPRAELVDSIGYEEFISEANLLLTTYGSSIPTLRTRSQILARYFPETIAILAKFLQKSSPKSLLE